MSISDQTLAALRTTPLFAGLPPDDIRTLVQQAGEESVADGAYLFRQDQPADRLIVLLSGHAELLLEEEGRSSLVEVCAAPALLGEAALMVGGVQPLSARCVGPVRLLSIPTAPMRASLEPRFDLIQKMLGALSVQMRVLVRQITELKLKTTAQRLGDFLLGLTTAEEGPAKVRFPYDKRLAAASLGMTPESLSRALSRLAPLGVEALPDNVVKIADVERLRDFCGEEAA